MTFDTPSMPAKMVGDLLRSLVPMRATQRSLSLGGDEGDAKEVLGAGNATLCIFRSWKSTTGTEILAVHVSCMFSVVSRMQKCHEVYTVNPRSKFNSSEAGPVNFFVSPSRGHVICCSFLSCVLRTSRRSD